MRPHPTDSNVRWIVRDIYCRNKSLLEETFNAEEAGYDDEEAKPVTQPDSLEFQKDAIESSLAEAAGEGSFPDCLLSAVALLVDNDEITEDGASSLLASYGHNQLLQDVYDHFIDFGGVDEFLSMVSIPLLSSRRGPYSSSEPNKSSSFSSSLS